MYSDEKIFGPLTFKQFLLVAFCVGIGWYVFENFAMTISIPVILIFAGICIGVYLNTPKVVFDEQYLKHKKSLAKTPEEYDRWARSKIATIESQMYFMQQRKMKPDPKLENALQMLKDSLQE